MLSSPPFTFTPNCNSSASSFVHYLGSPSRPILTIYLAQAELPNTSFLTHATKSRAASQHNPEFKYYSFTMSSPQDNRDGGADELNDSMNNLAIGGGEERLGPDGEPLPKTDEEYADTQLTLRAIVSSKEAGVIIGKGGKNVADLRDETGVKAGVSKVVQGVHDRVLTIAGGCESISKAYATVAKALLEGAPQMGMGGVVNTSGTHRKFLLYTNYETYLIIHSHQAPHFSQPDGHDHWQTRP